MWGATVTVTMSPLLVKHFNPRAPCGARRPCLGCSCQGPSISIHAPRVGRDLGSTSYTNSRLDFNPRAPCGARPKLPHSSMTYRNFNPRAPCGARRPLLRARLLGLAFQSTRPVWGATSSTKLISSITKISIHAPRVGRDDGFARGTTPPRRDFNPRAPCGARLY